MTDFFNDVIFKLLLFVFVVIGVFAQVDARALRFETSTATQEAAPTTISADNPYGLKAS